jgi:LPXTG-site transpeptidase (sortase) family protein
MANTSGGSGGNTGGSSGGSNTGKTKKTNPASMLIPVTGFAPDVWTTLPEQPVEKAYSAYSGLVLDIPSLNVKMSIVGVPMTDDGWDVSWLNKDAGYLEGSAFPTMIGNSVITAHVWDALNNPGPFYNLRRLKYGDKILIHAWGKVFTYEVRVRDLLTPSEMNKVIKHEDLSWVTLVTCESYNPKTEDYRYRRMVKAVLVDVSTENVDDSK